MEPTSPGFAADPRPQIVGTADDDTLTGTADAEIICGLEGDDRIRGGGGNDTLHGGDGYHIDCGIHNDSCRTTPSTQP